MLKVIAPPWLALGFYKGVNHYNYQYKKDVINYEKSNQKTCEKPQYFYSGSFGHGLYGLFIYGNPFFVPLMFAKEIYRLEVNLRGLEEEKDNDDYYKI